MVQPPLAVAATMLMRMHLLSHLVLWTNVRRPTVVSRPLYARVKRWMMGAGRCVPLRTCQIPRGQSRAAAPTLPRLWTKRGCDVRSAAPAGAKPETTSTTPEVYELLLGKAFDFPHAERRPSAISVPGAQALWLAEEVASARPEAFLIGREFAHVHPRYDGSMHMMLPPEAVDEVLAKGWREPHPMARRGLIPPTAVMVYAPRDAAEVEAILHMIGVSYRFACGEGPAA